MSTERALFFDLDGTLLDRRLSFELFVGRHLSTALVDELTDDFAPASRRSASPFQAPRRRSLH